MAKPIDDVRFDKDYYANNGQSRDRPALWMYERLWKRYCCQGPVLEFGCGVGSFARRLTKHAEVYACETNSYARAKIAEVAPKAVPVISLSDIADHTCGSITALHVLEHIEDIDLNYVFAEFKRITQPGAKFLFVMPDLEGEAHRMKGESWSAFTDPTHINLKSNAEWEAFFTGQGLRSVHVFSDGFYDYPYGRSPKGRVLEPFRLAGTVTQFLLARPLMKRGRGENAIFILEAND